MDAREPSDDGQQAGAVGMLWGLKGSFTEYLSQMPDARSAAGNGAHMTSDGHLFYPYVAESSDYDPESQSGTIRFGGDIRFAAHGGMLFVRLADPWVTFEADTGVLSVADHESTEGGSGRLSLCRLQARPAELHRGVRAWLDVKATLTEPGAAVFNDVYPIGEVFDPLHVLMPDETITAHE